MFKKIIAAFFAVVFSALMVGCGTDMGNDISSDISSIMDPESNNTSTAPNSSNNNQNSSMPSNDTAANPKISKEEAKMHPERHVILRALGISKSVNFDVNKIENTQNKKYLLCTDGLVVANTDEEIFETIKNSNKEDICASLIALANDKGGHDNTTVMYVEM